MYSISRFLHIFLIFLFLVQIISEDAVDFSFAKKDIIENEDQCLRRPYWKQPEPFYFFPVIRAKLKEVGDKFSFKSRCFDKNIVIFKEMTKDTMTFTLQNYEKKETFCSEIFFFHTSDHNYFQFIAFQGEHNIVLKYITQDDKDEIRVNGVKLYNFCSSFMTTIQSLLKSLKAFLGGMGYDPETKNPRFRPTISRDQEKVNLRILELFNHYTPERRNHTIVNFDKNIVKSGDVILIQRMDGIDPLIMIGAGGRVAHCCVCAWKDNELYVVESQDAAYWPKKGVQKTKWEDWVKYAHNADFNVILIPLRDEYRNKFDVNKAWTWFEDEMEGLPYGFRNFVFSWIDTRNNSFPFILNEENDFEEFFFSVLSKVYPSLGAMAIPEKEGQPYSDGVAYTCSCFVIAFLEHGGMFGDIKVLPNEFTPRDLYTLDIFDKNFTRPQECIDDNPDLPYCQVTGKFIIELENYSTIKPYSHMNERCPSIGPDFIREDGC